MNDRPGRNGWRRIVKIVLLPPWRALRWCGRSRWRLIALTLVVFSLLTGGTFEAYEYWSSPSFCRSCHIMEPYHDSWAKSAHAKVRCVECHFEPGIENELRGKWVAIKQLASTITGAYSSMPYAEVSDASCMRSGCHTSTELARPVEFSARKIKFDHRAHTGEMRRGIKLACTSCHHQTLRDEHMEVNKSTCFLCHFKDAGGNGADHGKDIGDCATCHGPPEESKKVGEHQVVHAEWVQRGMQCMHCHVEVRSGAGIVGKERCLSCHNDKEQMARFDDFGAMHVEHVTKRKLHCYQCHGTIEHRFEKEARQPAAEDCARCHQGPHGAQAQLFAGQGAKGVAETPDTMHALGLDCVACHEPAGGGGNGTPHARTASCTACHQDRYAAYEAGIGERLGQMTSYAAKRHAAVEQVLAAKAGSELVDREVYRAVTSTGHNLRFLASAGAVHNPLYAVEILRAADRSLSLAEEKTGVSPEGDPPPGFAAEDCTLCHELLPDPGKIEIDWGQVFPHQVHVDKTGLDCTACHAGEQHPAHAPTAERTCKQCHDAENPLPKREGG